jgi:hypothetical protein
MKKRSSTGLLPARFSDDPIAILGIIAENDADLAELARLESLMKQSMWTTWRISAVSFTICVMIPLLLSAWIQTVTFHLRP